MSTLKESWKSSKRKSVKSLQKPQRAHTFSFESQTTLLPSRTTQGMWKENQCLRRNLLLSPVSSSRSRTRTGMTYTWWASRPKARGRRGNTSEIRLLCTWNSGRQRRSSTSASRWSEMTRSRRSLRNQWAWLWTIEWLRTRVFFRATNECSVRARLISWDLGPISLTSELPLW